MWFRNRWQQVFEENRIGATSSINIIFQCRLGGGRDVNLNWLLASNIFLSISKTTDGFDAALGVSLCPAGCDLPCILMMICSMQKAGGYVS